MHIADWGRPTGILMRLLFYPAQWLDGFVTTQDNVEGRLPEFMEKAGFVEVWTQKFINTVFGTMNVYRVAKN